MVFNVPWSDNMWINVIYYQNVSKLHVLNICRWNWWNSSKHHNIPIYIHHLTYIHYLTYLIGNVSGRQIDAIVICKDQIFALEEIFNLDIYDIRSSHWKSSFPRSTFTMIICLSNLSILSWWRWYQKLIALTEFDIYIFISVLLEHKSSYRRE